MAEQKTELELLQEENQTLRAENEATKKELDATVKANEKLSQKFEKLSKKNPSSAAAVKSFKDETFSVGDVEYRFKLPHVNLSGKKITFEDVLLDKELQTELIKRRSGMIAPVKGIWSEA